jgi:lipopolysaccharide export system permease protein
MRIIDRYLLRQFVQTFLICYLSLMGLYVVFDVFTNMEEFLRCGKEQGSVLGLVASFYGYRSFLFFDQTSGLLSLVAAMFTVSWIQRHNEMTALLSAGISRLRVAAPVIGAAVAMTFLASANREWLIPRFRDELARRPQDLIGDVGQIMQPQYDNQTDVFLQGNMTFDDRKRISEPSFVLPETLDKYGKQLVAQEAFYHPPQGNRPGGYLLDQVEKPTGLDQRPSLALDGRPVLITPRDAPDWLEPNQCFLASDVTFDQLTGGSAWRTYSSTATLIRGLGNPSLDLRADVRVSVHSRLIQPFLDVTLLFLGLPLVLTRENRNVFIAIGLCSAVASVFSLTVVASQHLGRVYVISPALAAWLPLMIFLPMAVAMADPMRR